MMNEKSSRAKEEGEKKSESFGKFAPLSNFSPRFSENSVYDATSQNFRPVFLKKMKNFWKNQQTARKAQECGRRGPFAMADATLMWHRNNNKKQGEGRQRGDLARSAVASSANVHQIRSGDDILQLDRFEPKILAWFRKEQGPEVL